MNKSAQSVTWGERAAAAALLVRRSDARAGRHGSEAGAAGQPVEPPGRGRVRHLRPPLLFLVSP